VPVVFLIAIVVVLVGVFFAATGRGGELAYEHGDHAPLDLGPVSPADIALLRPPTAMWGYNVQVTDAALDQIARAMRERDVMIAYLQEQLASLERNGSYAVPRGAHARQDPEDTEPLADPQVTEPLANPEATEPIEAAQATATSQAAVPPRTPLVLRASATKAALAPEPHEATQPSGTLADAEDREATQPSATLAPEDAPGPQGLFDAHGWWAEQKEAARAEDEADAEEQGW
jgi:hypothetical protein